MNLAAIEIGSHTARLLVVQGRKGPSQPFKELERKREYIRLADGIEGQKRPAISPAATERALKAVAAFQAMAQEFNATIVGAVVTGVLRQVVNARGFLRAVRDQTGIRFEVISGEEEARLTALGVRSAIDLPVEDVTIFDLGGGSTEFAIGSGAEMTMTSLPLGAAVLSQRFLLDDPPDENQTKHLEAHVDGELRKAFASHCRTGGRTILVGTGGTVTTLAAMIHGIDLKDIEAAMLNGLTLTLTELVSLFDELKGMTLGERVKARGLERGRADVILGGTGAVIRILHCFGVQRMLVSLSDLLEGTLISFAEEAADSSLQSST
jgi:exopolyphosphatase/guanosine-5'-triphosphate,3'-diphosphate pyrophosphatase